MSIPPNTYEKLGSFYLGREYDLQTKSLQDDLLLYDSKDLVTHGVVLGMTGSGKTGLCLAMLEEAAMDSIPAIIIDPKGDIPNLMLSFPEFKGSDFRPWVNEDDAKKKGKTPDEFAQGQADLWKKGLGEWGQTGERVKQFQEKVGINVYTPGSNSGIPVSILSSFDAPPFEILDEPELLGDRVENTVTSVLGLMGIEADPMQSQEHILFSQIFLHAWREEEDLTLPKLIERVQKPPFKSIGVVPLDSFMDEKKRFALAMQLNNLLASPGFQSWTQGVPLDVKRLMHDETGKPQISIFSIAHLGDSERMFFVSMLLNQMLSWMRTQSGTSSLRAILYMDEIYGYLPPVQNPPSKKPLLTMLKQARAFGLGCLLATQNPVDLDYKALSNIGSWFLGRLQTARDKARVLDGLEGAAASQGGNFDRNRMEEILAGLGSRVFLLNNVHEDGPVIFHVRWVMSYLRGPLSRRQIKQLMDPIKEALPVDSAVSVAAIAAEAPAEEAQIIYQLSKNIDEVYLSLSQMPGDRKVVYRPATLATVEVSISNNKYDIHGNRTSTFITPISESTRLDFDAATRFEKVWRSVDSEAVAGATRAHLPDFAQDSKYYTEQKQSLADWIYTNNILEIFEASELKAYSKIEESEADFRIRLQQTAREVRDEQLEKLRSNYASRLETKERKVQTAERALEREEEQAKSAKMGSWISMGSAILSAVLGRKRISMGSISKGATAARGMSRSRKESRDAGVAEDRVEDYREDLEALEAELQSEMEEIRQALDPLTIPLDKIRIKAYKKDIKVQRFALAWLPYIQVSDFEIKPGWLPNQDIS
ncbi:MAG: hypothetical protein ACI8T1_002260 [Verrucomicrobiales bacterium]|jgi:hypothetical protein